MQIGFEKWEGLGNDFLLVRETSISGELSPELVRALCDRRRGVGGDGVLLVRADSPRMIVLNADGSRPEMCGNGLRCVAAMLAAEMGPLNAPRAMTVATDAGERRARVSFAGTEEALVEVDMGRAEIQEDSEHADEGRRVVFTSVSVGNPHAISFAPFDRGERDRLGPLIERSTAGGTNVEFAHKSGPASFDLVVWERGVGYTQACGTGACATAALACARGLTPYGEPIRVRLPGGELVITVSAGLDIVMMGPARRVFRGTVEV
ncbi:MAG: diaminopimelate epimerase [Polyangiaceae bacterium]|nr:diaminopimelate epimerase [Polyangiaceae bacterium]